MSILGVGIGFPPQKEVSIAMVCGELDLLLEELLLMEVTLSRPVIVTRSPGLPLVGRLSVAAPLT